VAVSTPKKLSSDISAGRFHPVYYFYGTEAYRMTEAKKYLARQFLPDRQLTLNFSRFDGRSTRCADLLAELASLPMLGERQVIAVENLQSYKPTEIERLLGSLQPPDPNRIVVFSSPPSKIPKKTSAFYKKISEIAEVVEFGRLDLPEATGIITRRLANHKIDIEPQALKALAGLVAGDIGALENEVAKMVNYKEPGEKVTAADVELLAAGYEAYEALDLADKVVDGDRGRVLAQVRQLVARGSTPTGLLFFLGGHFLTLYLVKHGKPIEPWRRWLLPKFKGQADRYEARQLSRIIVLIAETDAAMRQGRALPDIMLDQLVLSIMAV